MSLAQCETLFYSARVCETHSSTDPGFTAFPPIASPAQALKLGRDQKIKSYLANAIREASDQELMPAVSACVNVDRFLQLLPAELPVTDPYVSESGSICFDWDEDPESQFSILLKSENKISYAAYFSGEKVNGSAEFSRVDLPKSLLESAKRWAERAQRKLVASERR